MLEALDFMSIDHQDPGKDCLQALVNDSSYRYPERISKKAQLGIESARSGGSSLVSMMKTADFWDRDDPALVERRGFSGLRRILVQREAAAAIVIIREIGSKSCAK